MTIQDLKDADVIQQAIDKAKNDPVHPLVVINCITYNHAPYLAQCLEGFVMQKTDFPFVALVHDDASPDGTAEVLREYAEKYPDIIKPICDSTNRYSDKSLDLIMNEWINAYEPKYIAICEGDDYWIDPLKLQKQVDWLEAHPEYSYVWTDANTQQGDIIQPYNRYLSDCDVSMEDVVMRGGLWIPTASIVIRRELLDIGFKAEFHVGDYPIQIWGASKGKVRYQANVTCVYRLASVGSWSDRMSRLSMSQKRDVWEKEHYLLQKMDELTDFQHHHLFVQRWHLYAYCNFLSINEYSEAQTQWNELDEKYKKQFPGSIHWCVVNGYFFMAKFLKSIRTLLNYG